MKKKYELTTKKKFNGITLYRIRALRDFGEIKAGERGGWIQKESNLSHGGKCWVCGEARIFGNAKVSEDAFIHGHAQIHGNAVVSGSSRISDNAHILENSKITGESFVYGDAIIMGSSNIHFSIIGYGAKCCENAAVHDSSITEGGHITSTVTTTPIVISGFPYTITIMDTAISIGCMTKTLTQWRRFNISRSYDYHKEAWNSYMPHVFEIAKLHQKEIKHANRIIT